MLFSLPSVSNDVLGSKVIYCSSILCSVIFSGGIVAASIPEISINGSFPTNVGSVARWLTMYPVFMCTIVLTFCIFCNNLCQEQCVSNLPCLNLSIGEPGTHCLRT